MKSTIPRCQPRFFFFFFYTALSLRYRATSQSNLFHPAEQNANHRKRCGHAHAPDETLLSHTLPQTCQHKPFSIHVTTHTLAPLSSHRQTSDVSAFPTARTESGASHRTQALLQVHWTALAPRAVHDALCLLQRGWASAALCSRTQSPAPTIAVDAGTCGLNDVILSVYPVADGLWPLRYVYQLELLSDCS